MSTVNHHLREINFKIVYYGTGLGGKTSSLQYLHRALKPETRGPLIMLPTSQDRTLYFDFLPLRLPKLGGYCTRLHLYTVPGQVHYNSTRKLVLSGADGIVFVVDSQRSRLEANVESLYNLVENLGDQSIALSAVPWVMQYNKRDLPDAMPVAELEEELNADRVPAFESVATSGVGVAEALRSIVRLILLAHRDKVSERQGQAGEQTPPPTPPPVAGDGAAVVEPRPQRTTGQVISSISEAIAGLLATGAQRAVDDGAPPVRSPSSLSGLVRSPEVAEAIVAVEQDIARGLWAEAVRRAVTACREVVTAAVGGLASEPAADSFAMSAFAAGVPVARFLRLREVEARIGGESGVASRDAVFALFFLIDFAVRAEEGQGQ